MADKKPKQGMKLHHWVALGGKPQDFKGSAKGQSANKNKK